MTYKYGKFIAKYKVIVLIIAIVLLIPSIIGYLNTKINYDILSYLPSDIETMQGQEILGKDFKMEGFAYVVTENLQNKDLIKIEDQIREIEGVGKVVSGADVIGTDIPLSMVPSQIKDKLYNDNLAIIIVTFEGGDVNSMTACENLKKVLSENEKLAGITPTLLDTKDLSSSEMPLYVVIAVILCLIVLQITLDSYAVPVLLLANIGFAVLYNMGTNIMFGEISYITKAISAALQLGVTMDFAIFLYHSYMEEKKKRDDNDESMAKAITKTISAVFGSSFTTFAGFIALCGMQLILGRDIGLVMAKGVLFGLISAVTVLPALILVFDKLIAKTKHKPLMPEFKGWKNFSMKFYKWIIGAFIIILPFAFYGYKNVQLYYNLTKSLPDTLESIQANEIVKEKFNITSPELVLINKDMPEYKSKELAEKIEKVDGVEWIISFDKIAGEIPSEMVPDSIKELLESDKYRLFMINSKYEMASEGLNNQISETNKLLKEYDEKAILAGQGALTNDLIQIAAVDFQTVNIISIVVIFFIMAIVLKSVVLPIILICIIEFAIFINMAVPFYTGEVIPFISSIVIGTIQLGATIDYAILITTKYKFGRIEGQDKKEAVEKALGTSISSIITSALCFFGATFGIGIISKIDMISSMCMMMARGSVISSIVVITCLPAFLLAFDKAICKTTWGMKEVK